WVTERQEIEFSQRGLDFNGLFGRPLQPIACQNLFCEVSKYTRVAHPEIRGIANRQRIKQAYKRSDRGLPMLSFPPRWKLEIEEEDKKQRLVASDRQLDLLAHLCSSGGLPSNVKDWHGLSLASAVAA